MYLIRYACLRLYLSLERLCHGSYMCVCVCVHAYTQTYVHMHTKITRSASFFFSTSECMNIQAYIYTRPNTHTRMHTHTFTQIHTYAHTPGSRTQYLFLLTSGEFSLPRTRKHTCTHAHLHTYLHLLPPTHTRTHTHTYIHIHIRQDHALSISFFLQAVNVHCYA